ncbi:hypothetical protein QZH56_01245 [Streptomyces olivoreticuli]|uniref:hypothetical protein n=1 Tax=Streptomyces olivoreticuli TaxID=68246 RepID=UPI002658BAEB|nr:hypothetical protein [Streptomyces olivoreticuli]WKK24324.1 hypothetical protein QZH56_01245 [Streptomyces olivoreticuli]
MQNTRPIGTIPADSVVNDSGVGCEFAGIYSQGSLVVRCSPGSAGAAVDIDVTTRAERGGFVAEYTVLADGKEYAIQPPSGKVPEGRALIEVRKSGASGPGNLQLGAGQDNVGRPAWEHVEVPSVEIISPQHLPTVFPPNGGEPIPAIAQAGLARAADSFAQLVADKGLDKIDFKGFGRSLKFGTQFTGTIANVHAFSKAVAADDWENIILGGISTAYSTASTASSLVSTASEVLETALRAGKKAHSPKLATFVGKLANKVAGPLGLGADMYGLVNTSVDYAKGKQGAHTINVVVDGSAVVGSTVALVPGFGPVGLLIAVPAILYTAADVFMLNPALPDEQIRSFKSSVRQAVAEVDDFMDNAYRDAVEGVNAKYELYLEGLQRQCRGSLDSAEYREALEGYQAEQARELAQLAARRPELAKAALKGAVQKARVLVHEQLDENRDSFLLGKIAPTRGLDMGDFIKGKGWTLDPLVEIDAYWRDFIRGSVRNVIRELSSFSTEEIEAWAGREFDQWPTQPKKNYASWLPFG